MKSLKVVFVVVLLAFHIILLAEPVEITLQNGHLEYSGCVDAHIQCLSPDKNFADLNILETRNDGN